MRDSCHAAVREPTICAYLVLEQIGLAELERLALSHQAKQVGALALVTRVPHCSAD